jgi:hypothetical protein
MSNHQKLTETVAIPRYCVQRHNPRQAESQDRHGLFRSRQEACRRLGRTSDDPRSCSKDLQHIGRDLNSLKITQQMCSNLRRCFISSVHSKITVAKYAAPFGQRYRCLWSDSSVSQPQRATACSIRTLIARNLVLDVMPRPWLLTRMYL